MFRASPSARIWGTTEKTLDYNELLSIPQSKEIGKSKMSYVVSYNLRKPDKDYVGLVE